MQSQVSIGVQSVAPSPQPGQWMPWSIAAVSLAVAVGAVWVARRRPAAPPAPPAQTPSLEDISLQTLLLESSAGRIEQALAQVVDDSGTIVAVSSAWQNFVEDNSLDPRHARSGESLVRLAADPTGLLGDIAPIAARALSSVITGKSSSLRIEYRLEARGGANVTLCAVRIGEGQAARTVVMHIPGNDRMRLTALLQESERRYRLLFRLSPLPMIVISQFDGRILAANEAAAGLLGFSAHELEGRLLPTIIDARESDTVRAALETTGNPFTPASFRRSDGAIIRAELHFAALAFEGAPARLMVLRDLTAQLVAQRASSLRESMLAAVAHAGERLVEEDDWRAGLRGTLPGLLEAAQADRVLVFRFDPSASPSLAIVGAWPEGADAATCFPGWDEVCEPAGLEAMRHGRSVENKVITCEIGRAPMLIAAAPVLVGGDLWGFIALKRVDTSRLFGAAENDSLRSFAGIIGGAIQRTQIQEALRKSDDQVRHAQKIEAVGQLASGISHDFNNLLTAIHGYLALAKGSLAADHPAAYAMEQVEIAAQQAGGVANSLLTFTRRTQGERRLVQLSALVEPAIRLVRRSLPANINLTFEPPPGPSPWVSCDPSQIQQVLVALALNARDAMPSGGSLRIVLGGATTPAGESAATVTVEDTGRGMTPEVLQRAFEPFFTTKPRTDATGLGLSISHSIVQQHGGTIDVSSEPGRGSCFVVRLPAAQGPVETALVESKGPSSYFGAAVIVEDHELVGALVSTTLASMGFSPIQVRRVAEAEVEILKPPVVLVVDIELPDANGVEWVRTLRQRGLMTPVLFISGRVEPGTESGELAPAAILHKPFQTASLTRCLRELVRPVERGVVQ